MRRGLSLFFSAPLSRIGGAVALLGLLAGVPTLAQTTDSSAPAPTITAAPATPSADLPHVMVDDPDHGNMAAPRIAPPSTPSIDQRPTYTLRECIDIALRQNPDLLIAKKNIEAADGGILAARAAFLPQLQSNGLFERIQQGFATIQPQDPDQRPDQYYVTVQVSESLYSGGANTSRMKIARLAKSTQMLNYQTAIDTAILNVRLAYYSVLLAQANIEVRTQAVDLLSRQADAEQNKLTTGLTSRTSVLRAQVSRANELPALLAAKNDLLNGYVKLSQLLNIPYKPGSNDPPFQVTGSLGYSPRKYNLADLLDKADSARPELKAAANAIETEEKQLVVDRSAILPHINAFAGYDVTSEASEAAFRSYEDGYTVGLAGTWQIFDGFAAAGHMKSTKARMQAAIATRDQTRLQIEADVRQAYNQLEEAASTVESQDQNVTLARESYVLQNASYDAGLATQLDALQGQVDLTTAQTTEFQARYDYLAATAQLQRSLSGQFEIVNDTLPPSAPSVQPLPPDTTQKKDMGPGDTGASGSGPAPSFPPPAAPVPAAPSTPSMVPVIPTESTLPENPGPLPPLPVPSPIAPPGAAPYPSAIPNNPSPAQSRIP